MKLLTLLLLISVSAFGQKNDSTKSVTVTEYQMSVINDLQKQIADAQAQLQNTLDLITGVKQVQITNFKPSEKPVKENVGQLFFVKPKE